MKSERRHELTTNELADWIANLPKWIKENQMTVLVAALAVAALIAYTIFYYTRENKLWDEKNAQTTALLDQVNWQKQTVVQGKTQGLGVSDLFLNTASSLQTAASETDNEILSALAIIKRAEALRAELHYRPTVAEPDVRKFQLQQAQKAYEQALEKAKNDPQTAAMAEYGIAISLEDMGDIEGAKKAYEKIVQEPKYDGTTYQNRAQVRLETMDENSAEVILARAEVPQTPETIEIQPPGQLNLDGSIDMNQITTPQPQPDSNQPK
ncbi:MAG: hypothetical protein A2Y10_19135 [Planctomycetes bacterium GWF2_41_51]|nr:MAG: hypothetical protein A2Y10_19135 [Planctomycetes bacterium GWF2_41_51]HBG27420.1 hypothetical protein [Phycisphaerales bacterium]